MNKLYLLKVKGNILLWALKLTPLASADFPQPLKNHFGQDPSACAAVLAGEQHIHMDILGMCEVREEGLQCHCSFMAWPVWPFWLDGLVLYMPMQTTIEGDEAAI